MTLVLIATLVVKFALPLAIIRYPFAASWLNFVLDTSDGDILMRVGLSFDTYQFIDKIADYVTYVAMLVAGWRWKIKRTIIALFALRTVGQILFFATGNEIIFFFFPNFLEPLFMIYALLLWKFRERAHVMYVKYIWLIWFIVVSYKMWNEWNTHVANIELSKFFFGF